MPERRDRKNRLLEWRGAGDEAHLSLTADQYRAVRERHQREQAKHRAVTQSAREWARRFDAEIWNYNPSAKTAKNSFKTLESFARKVAGDLHGDTSTERAKALAKDTKDLHRFTFIWPADKYVDRAKGMFDYREQTNLEEYKVKHTWEKPMFKGLNWVVGRNTPPGSTASWSVDSYDSLEMAQRSLRADGEDRRWGVFKTQDGVKFEVQAHTPETVAINKKTHDIYEAQRVSNQDDFGLQTAFNYMRYRAYIDNGVVIPANIGRLPGNAGRESPPPAPTKEAWDRAQAAVRTRELQNHPARAATAVAMGAPDPASRTHSDASVADSFAGLSLASSQQSLTSRYESGARPSFESPLAPSIAGLASRVAEQYPRSDVPYPSYARFGPAYHPSASTAASISQGYQGVPRAMSHQEVQYLARQRQQQRGGAGRGQTPG